MRIQGVGRGVSGFAVSGRCCNLFRGPKFVSPWLGSRAALGTGVEGAGGLAGLAGLAGGVPRVTQRTASTKRLSPSRSSSSTIPGWVLAVSRNLQRVTFEKPACNRISLTKSYMKSVRE